MLLQFMLGALPPCTIFCLSLQIFTEKNWWDVSIGQFIQNDQKTIVCDGPLQKMLTEDVMMDYSSTDVFCCVFFN